MVEKGETTKVNAEIKVIIMTKMRGSARTKLKSEHKRKCKYLSYISNISVVNSRIAVLPSSEI